MGNKGRRKAVGVKRTASGRRSRASAAYEENVDPILTRMRLFGLTEPQARDQKAATFVGRLQLTKAISVVQYDAAVEYLEIVNAARRAIAAPDGLRDSGGPGGGQADTPEYSAWCARAKATRDALEAAVMRQQCLHRNRGTNLFAALDYIVLRDEVAWHMVGDVRLALNAVVHHLGLMGKHALAA